MRIHVGNVVATALKRGVTIGYYKTCATTPTEKQAEISVNTILESIWESLDELVDFDEDSDESSTKSPIGFSPAVDAVGEYLTPDDDTDTLDL